MSLKNRRRVVKTLAFRLAVLYAGLSVMTLLGVSLVAYIFLNSALQRELDQGLLNEIEEYGTLLDSQNLDVLRDVLVHEAISEGTDKLFFRIADTSGKVILATEMAQWKDVPLRHTHLLAAAAGRIVFESCRSNEHPDSARVVYGPIGKEWVLQIGESASENMQMLREFREVFMVTSIPFTLCSLVLGVFMARRSLSGVQHVVQTARSISSGNWDSRVSVSARNDEIDELAGAFNEMIDRIQMLVRELREVLDDVAHDLRTPVTRMRAEAEVALRQSDGAAQQQNLASSFIEECDHLLAMINTTLEISQTEAGASVLRCERMDLSVLLEEVADLFQYAAEDKQLSFNLHNLPGLFVNGDPLRLRRAFAHLVDNAVKYTQPGGRVNITCARERGTARIYISDTGPGIEEEDLQKVFRRFFRLDPSRTQSGSGLGLSLARAIFRAHGGDITVKSIMGSGSTFTATLPEDNS